MPRDYDLKTSRNTMTVSISTGLPRDSSKILFENHFSHGFDFLFQKDQLEKPLSNRNIYKLKNRKSSLNELSFLFLYFKNNFSRPPPPPRVPEKPRRQKKVRALYDFQARSADELSFRADQELVLLDKTGKKIFSFINALIIEKIFPR